MQTESVHSDEDVNSFLSGKLRTSIECCNCGSFSLKEEVFNDIPLSFHQENTLGEISQQTLKGGDQSDMKRKIGCKFSEASDAKQTLTDEELAEMTSPTITSRSIELKQFEIRDMINSYLAPELLKDTNKYYCETCQSLQDAMKNMTITSFPKYLILTMKRFTYNVTTQKRSKLLHVVNHPQIFSFCDFCLKCHFEIEQNESVPGSSRQTVPEKDKCNKNNQKHFRLLCVIVHSGHSSDSGHYYSYTCEYFPDDTYKWFLLNDSRVSAAPDDCIMKLSSRFPQDSPYVCIYECFNPNDDSIDEEINTHPSILDTVGSDDASYERVCNKITSYNDMIVSLGISQSFLRGVNEFFKGILQQKKKSA